MPSTKTHQKSTSQSVIAYFTLVICDIRQSTVFFHANLGWKPIALPGNVSFPAAWLQISPDQELHLVQVADFTASDFEREMGRYFAIAYPLSGFEALKQRIVDHGGELVDPERDTPFEEFFFRDPNGYVFEIVEADHEPETQANAGQCYP